MRSSDCNKLLIIFMQLSATLLSMNAKTFPQPQHLKYQNWIFKKNCNYQC